MMAAATSPDVVLSLLARLAVAEAAVVRVQEVLDDPPWEFARPRPVTSTYQMGAWDLARRLSAALTPAPTPDDAEGKG